MNWNWKKYIRKNSYKILAHQFIEYSILGSVYIGMEGDPKFWVVGILLGSFIHLVVFTKIDFQWVQFFFFKILFFFKK